MSGSKESKEVNMYKARMITFVVSASVLLASSAGFCRGLGFFLGKGTSWFEL